MKKILVVAATPFEIAPLHAYLSANFKPISNSIFQHKKIEVHILITGIGLTHTAYAMGRYIGTHRPDWAINMGIAGAFDKKLNLGDVVQVTSDRFGDLGAEMADGQFKDLFEMGLWQSADFPFKNGQLMDTNATDSTFLPQVKGISVQKVNGYPPNIALIAKKYNADIETMEGAAFSYVCLQEKLFFLAIRAISNYVEARNKDNWKIELAIKNLNGVVVDMIRTML